MTEEEAVGWLKSACELVDFSVVAERLGVAESDCPRKVRQARRYLEMLGLPRLTQGEPGIDFRVWIDLPVDIRLETLAAGFIDYATKMDAELLKKGFTRGPSEGLPMDTEGYFYKAAIYGYAPTDLIGYVVSANPHGIKVRIQSKRKQLRKCGWTFEYGTEAGTKNIILTKTTDPAGIVVHLAARAPSPATIKDARPLIDQLLQRDGLQSNFGRRLAASNAPTEGFRKAEHVVEMPGGRKGHVR